VACADLFREKSIAGWWVMLIYYEKKVQWAGWWLVPICYERKVQLASWC
jgi:hypothetical protein